ncbi:hypothetical protein [Bremerella cremea]|uniref:hypothetical protein n=1 Tax=Bremerella cremea TaxID=1031537 RepID=UPI0031EEE2F7
MSHTATDDPELFVLPHPFGCIAGKWELDVSPERITFVPVAHEGQGCLPWIGLFIGSLFAALGYIHFFEGADYAWLKIFLLALIIVVSGLSAAGTILIHQSKQAAEKWADAIVIDRNAQAVRLVQHGLTIPLSDIDHLQVITTPYMKGVASNEERIPTQLNLVATIDGERRRICLIADGIQGELESIAQRIANEQIMPVKQIRRDSLTLWLTTKDLTPQRS